MSILDILEGATISKQLIRTDQDVDWVNRSRFYHNHDDWVIYIKVSHFFV